MRYGIVALPLLCSLTATAREPADMHWTDDPLSRMKAMAMLQSLNADLLSHPSATLTLERWCGAHHLARDAKVVARRVKGVDKPLPDGAREQLGIGADEAVSYRQVQLVCGNLVLSEADNWYVPARLSAEMNHELDSTDVPFGKVVQSLHFRRQTLSAELLWSPLPQGWDDGVALPPGTHGPLVIPAHVLQHRAVLVGQDNRAISLVVESYTSNVLAMPSAVLAPTP
ncbi:chorismate lyase [Dyella sp. OK004]|nr:chorismate lyase [Dyella sp. OK004]